MWWLKRDIWKAGFAVAGVLLLLILMTWIPLSTVGAYETTQLGYATAATPTVDLTVTALVKDQLKQQDVQLQRDNSFPWTILNAVGSSIGTILVATAALIAAGIGFWQWLGNRKDEQKKRDEDRFQAVVTGLGSQDLEAKVGAAIMLRTFLRPGYKQFYGQAFDLAVAHLRLQRHTAPDVSKLSDSLNQALVTIFKESYPRVRDLLRERSQFLDAASIQLDKRDLFGADLKNVWMPETVLRNANLSWVNFTWANLSKGNLSGANLSKANLFLADLSGANLVRAKLAKINLTKGDNSNENLVRAILLRLNLKEVNLSMEDIAFAAIPVILAILKKLDFQKRLAKELGYKPALIRFALAYTRWTLIFFNIYLRFASRKRNREMAIFVVNKIMEDPLLVGFLSLSSEASPREATIMSNSLFKRLFETNLSEANLSMANLKEVDLNQISSLRGAKMVRIIGPTNEQLEACKEKGAIIDEDITASPPQSTVSLTASEPRNTPTSPIGFTCSSEYTS
jgi:uncharacterized protein YjbI with pentapeptide repeats